jgi:hypothetical protein
MAPDAGSTGSTEASAGATGDAARVGEPRRATPARAALIVGSAAALAAAAWVMLFAVPHGLVSVRVSEYGCRVAPASGACAESHLRTQLAWIVPVLIDGVGWSAACVLLVLAGRRSLALVPALATVLLPAVFSMSDRWDSFGGRFVGVFFWPESFTRVIGQPEPLWIAHRPLGGVLGFLLVLTPAITAFVVLRPARAPRLGPRQLAGVAMVGASIAAVAWLLGPFNLFRVGDAPSAIAVVALGAGLGVSSRRRVAALAIMPPLLTSLVATWSVGWALGFASSDPTYLVGGLLAAMWIGVAFLSAEAARPDPLRFHLRLRPRSRPVPVTT